MRLQPLELWGFAKLRPILGGRKSRSHCAPRTEFEAKNDEKARFENIRGFWGEVRYNEGLPNGKRLARAIRGGLLLGDARVDDFRTGVDGGVGGGADGGETVQANGVNQACVVIDAADEMLVLIEFLEPRLPVHTALSGRCQE
jgi:hypothetical protein